MKQELVQTCLQKDREGTSGLKFQQDSSIVSHIENKPTREGIHPYIKLTNFLIKI
jgi:hypothetical protein